MKTNPWSTALAPAAGDYQLVGWLAHQLPPWLLKAGTAGTLLVELIVPFFLCLPRPWRLWFVPRGPLFLDWFGRFLERLAAGSPAVTGLLARPPCDEGAPQRLRVQLWRYRFATPAERAEQGVWWVREDLGPFHPLPSLHGTGSQ